ncbi:MAG: glycosyltransferase [Actinomycetia bacterium]|nr:glycosyltransferase [Actinomycetes bacterium]
MHSTNKQSCTVVVCAYTLERWDDIEAGVRQAEQQLAESGREGLVLIVSDHNPDLYGKATTDLAGERVQVIENARRRGLSGARNTAVEQLSTDLVVFLDDDAVPEPGWLEALLAPFQDPAVVATGGAAEPRWPDGCQRPATLPAPPGQPGELDWVVGCTYHGQPTTLAPVRNVMGCSMAFRTRVFDVTGGFGEDLGRVGKVPYGCEETELCIRATQAEPSSRILFEPRSLVRHRVSPDRLTWSYLWRRCYAEGISKAAVTERTTRSASLSTELSYTTKVLPAAVLRELRTTPSSPRRGLAGAFAVVSGLAVTTLGYIVGRVAIRRGRTVSLKESSHP